MHIQYKHTQAKKQDTAMKEPIIVIGSHRSTHTNILQTEPNTDPIYAPSSL